MLEGVNYIRRSMFVVCCTYMTFSASCSVSLVVHKDFDGLDRLDQAIARSRVGRRGILGFRRWAIGKLEGEWTMGSLEVRTKAGLRSLAANRWMQPSLSQEVDLVRTGIM